MTEKALEKALDVSIALGTVLGKAILIIFIGYIAIKILLKITKKALSRTNLDPSLHTFIVNSVKIILWIILIVTTLGTLGVATSTFVALLGAGGAAIALALKDSLGNIAGGIIILVTKPFKMDDFIDLIEVSGKVQKIDLLYTTLKTFDNKVISVPNGRVTNSILLNYSKEDMRRVDCNFCIGYHDSIAKSKDILAAVAAAHPLIHVDPAPLIGVSGQHDSHIALDLKAWCQTEDYWDVKYFLEENVKLAFDEAGITIPFPQLDVHIKK